MTEPLTAPTKVRVVCPLCEGSPPPNRICLKCDSGREPVYCTLAPGERERLMREWIDDLRVQFRAAVAGDLDGDDK